MSESDFKAWAMQAALARDEAIRKLEEAADAEKKMITEYLRAELNKNSRTAKATLPWPSRRAVKLFWEILVQIAVKIPVRLRDTTPATTILALAQ